MRVSKPAKIKIRNYTKEALEVLASTTPNLLVTPSCISVFVRCGNFFYPVTDILIKHTPYDSCGSLDFVVDPYSFCSDPRDIKTPISGESLINFNEGGDEIESLTCLSLVDKRYEFCESRARDILLNSKVVSAYLSPNTNTPGCLIFDINRVKIKVYGTDRIGYAEVR